MQSGSSQTGPTPSSRVPSFRSSPSRMACRYNIRGFTWYSVTLIKMAETGGKKGKKKKGKTLNLVEFLTDNSQNSTASLGPVLKSTSSWADESEDLPTEVDNRWPADDSYGGGPPKRPIQLAALPTAPRAALEMQIDYSKIPEHPPFTAFLGNLPYDVEKGDILDFFKDIKITEVRLPQDTGGGRAKGFGYAEFDDRESLVKALSMNNETLRGRKIRIDVAGQNQGGERDRGDKDEGPDLTLGDWRAQPDEPRSGNRYGSSNGYQDRYSRDGSRYDRRDDGWGRDSDRGRYYDDQRYPDSYDDRRPRDRYDNYRYGDHHDNYRHGSSYQRDSWGGRYGDRDRRDGRGGRDSNDPYAGVEFTRDQARPPARGPASQNDDSLNDREDRSSGDMDDRGYGDRGGRGYGDRDRGYGDRDRGYGDRDRGYGDRDHGYGDRDRGYGDRDRGYSDRDRGYGDRDRGYGDRDRGYGDRDRGYGDRGYGDRGYGDRDRRYGDRDGRYGDRDRGYGDRSRGYGDRDRGYGDRDRGYGDRGRDFGDRDGYRRDFGGRGGQDDPEPAKERPRLQLKPRSKPVEEAKPEPAESRSPSIFGGAKPVDTTAKEKEIEEKLEKLKVEVDPKKEKERDNTYAKEGEYRSRRDSGRSGEGETRSRKDSGRSSEENGPSSRGRKDSEKSLEKEGTATTKEGVQDAPPPTVNVWKQRMDAQKSGAITSDKPKDDATSESSTEKPVSEKTADRKPVSSNSPTSPVGRGSNPRQHNRGSERGGGAWRGRGRGRGEHSRPQEAGDSRNREERRERREKKAPELKKVEDQPPVFHQTSKFSLLMDEDGEEEDGNESAET